MIYEFFVSPWVRLVEAVIIAHIYFFLARKIGWKDEASRTIVVDRLLIGVYVLAPPLAFFVSHVLGVKNQFWNTDIYPLSNHMLFLSALVLGYYLLFPWRKVEE